MKKDENNPAGTGVKPVPPIPKVFGRFNSAHCIYIISMYLLLEMIMCIVFYGFPLGIVGVLIRALSLIYISFTLFSDRKSRF